MENRKNILVIIIWIALISIFIASLFAEATAKEIEDTENLIVQESPVQQPPKAKHTVDSFTMAIIGISLGCMMIASSVHWHLSERRQLEAKMLYLDTFLKNTCAVDFHITGCKDTDPMMNNAQAIQNSRDMKIKEFEEHRNMMTRSVSDIEAEIMRILG